MSKKATKNTNEPIEQIEGTLSNIESFLESNKKSITIIVCGILLAVAMFFSFKHWYLDPQSEEALSRMFVAERLFRDGEYQKALDGEASELGFLAIIDNYSVTPAANLAYYYSGICYLRLGEYDKAIAQLKQFDSDDKMVSNIAIGAIGDAYAELGQNDEAIKYYVSAAEHVVNDFTTPLYLMRAGLLCESMNQPQKALEFYKRIQKNHPDSEEGTQIEKYISRLQAN